LQYNPYLQNFTICTSITSPPASFKGEIYSFCYAIDEKCVDFEISLQQIKKKADKKIDFIRLFNFYLNISELFWSIFEVFLISNSQSGLLSSFLYVEWSS